MSDTLMSMEFAKIDRISAWQLENNDIIKIEDEYVTVTNVLGVEEGILITYSNDFGEEDSVTFDDDDVLDLFMYI